MHNQAVRRSSPLMACQVIELPRCVCGGDNFEEIGSVLSIDVFLVQACNHGLYKADARGASTMCWADLLLTGVKGLGNMNTFLGPGVCN